MCTSTGKFGYHNLAVHGARRICYKNLSKWCSVVNLRKMDFEMIRCIIALSLVLLSACAATPTNNVVTPEVQPLSFNDMLKKADAALDAGNTEEAFSQYETITESYPNYKSPWQKMAQIKFDAHYYGQAILYAQKLLTLDPVDQFAHSISAVSGLRLSSYSLGVLRRENSLSGSLMSEATSLTEVLQDNLGVKKIVAPVPKKKKYTSKPKPRPEVIVEAQVMAEKNTSSPMEGSGKAENVADPFGALQ